jgi:hypothetical protein
MTESDELPDGGHAISLVAIAETALQDLYSPML